MPPRTIDAPEKEWLSLADVLRWLGIGRDLFRQEVERYADWLRPRRIGGREKWHWLDVFCLSRIIHCRQETPETAQQTTTARQRGAGQEK